jgi:glycosyltransferase involved in cell wall biosynthesis
MNVTLRQPTLTYVIPFFDRTGAMRSPYLICKGFLRQGWQVEVVAAASPQNADIDTVWGSVPVHKIDGANKKIKLLRLFLRLLGRGEQQVVITWVWYWHCFALLLAKWLFGQPYVLVLDTYTHRSGQGFWRKLREELRYGPLLRGASLILAETPACLTSAAACTGKENVLLAPSGLWLDELRKIEANWRATGYQPAREPVILYAGRLVAQKRVHDLISAFGTLAAQYPAWRLEIRGVVTDAEYFAHLQNLAKASGVGERILFLPSLSGESLYRCYRASAIYALPSEGEGFPTTILEAMYFGGAIVAGDSGYVGYQLAQGHCGLLHTPGDLNQLTTHLATLMHNEATRKQLIQSARQRMIESFTWDHQFPVLAQKFEELLTSQ